MKQILSLLFVGSILFLCSCEKEYITSENQEITTEERAKPCFTANKLEELDEGCCVYNICTQSLTFGEFFIIVPGQPLIPLSPETGCAEVTVCGITDVTLIEIPASGVIDVKPDEKWSNGCTKTLYCHDREACCESICFDFNLEPEPQGLCTDFAFTLDGDDTCFPDGIPMTVNNQLPVDIPGPIVFVEANSPHGTVELFAADEANWFFEFCLNDLHQENIIEITFHEFFCDTDITVAFDLLQPDAPFHRRCD